MNPPYSMMLFTVLAGAAQGLLLALVGVEALMRLRQLVGIDPSVFVAGALLVLVFGIAGLAAATFHLGHPMRAWRAMAAWRTSWLSREVIVLPLFLACVAGWGLAHMSAQGRFIVDSTVWGAAAALLALALYGCTAMIYAAVRAIRQWAHPITVVNYTLIGLASGALLACTLLAWRAPDAGTTWGTPLLTRLALPALLLTLAAAATRAWAFWRNATLVPRTTLQTAIGVRHPRIVQTAQGALGGSFQTKEFFHGRSAGFATQVRLAAVLLGFALPALALAWVLMVRPDVAVAGRWLALVFVLQLAGLFAERWSFFAEGTHTQNLYHAQRA